MDLQIFYIEYPDSVLCDTFRLSRGSSKNALDSCALASNIDKKGPSIIMYLFRPVFSSIYFSSNQTISSGKRRTPTESESAPA